MSKTLNVIPVTSADYQRLAEKRLPRFLIDYIDGGANEEQTLRANTCDFDRITVRQQVLRDVSVIDTSTTLRGEALALPLTLAPVGMAGMYARRGEAMASRAAKAAGIPFTLSTVGICPLEEIRAATEAPFWFQLYMIRDRGAIKELLQRANAAGCSTLVFTVDLPAPGMRHRDTRNGIVTTGTREKLARARQLATRPGWLWDVGIMGKPHDFGNLAHFIPDASNQAAVRQWVNQNFDPTVTWKDIDWLRGIWPGTLIIKGIQEVDDALAAARVGAEGLVVSNHGGRQLGGVASSISKLPAIADAVGDRLDVLMDGGVRSGLDIFKAIALGAKAVMIGRPWAWAIAGAGEQGLNDLLANFKRELEVAMMLAGVTRITDITRERLDRFDFGP